MPGDEVTFDEVEIARGRLEAVLGAGFIFVACSLPL